MRKTTLFLAASLILSAAPPAKEKAQPAALPAEFMIKTPELARTVQVSIRDTVRVRCHTRMSTMIVLPEGENILDALNSDPDYWTIPKPIVNMILVKPTAAPHRTNLHAITASGNAYTFELIADDSVEPDFKVFIETSDDRMLAGIKGPKHLVLAADLETWKRAAEDFQAQVLAQKIQFAGDLEKAKAEAEKKALQDIPKKVRYNYKIATGQAPFNVAGMWDDGTFTYIKARPREAASVYEVLDGKPNIVNFQLIDGLYRFDKVLGDGYLQVGKKKQEFKRIEN